MNTKGKMLWNFNLFFKDMYGVQSGEFLCLDIGTQSTNRVGFDCILVH